MIHIISDVLTVEISLFPFCVIHKILCLKIEGILYLLQHSDYYLLLETINPWHRCLWNYIFIYLFI